MDTIFKSVDSVPWVWGYDLDNSDEAYLATYKSLGRDRRDIEDRIRSVFPEKKVTICDDMSLRGYYIFVSQGK